MLWHDETRTYLYFYVMGGWAIKMWNTSSHFNFPFGEIQSVCPFMDPFLLLVLVHVYLFMVYL